METGAGVLATVCDYDGLIDAIRAQKEKLGLSDAVVDDLTGLQSGYTGKLLGPAQRRNLGPMSLGVLLQALGLKLTVCEDAEQLAKLRGRYEQKCASQARFGNHAKQLGIRTMARVTPVLMREFGRLGGLARGAKQAKKFRTASARHAAKTRWAQHRSKQRARWREKQRLSLATVSSTPAAIMPAAPSED